MSADRRCRDQSKLGKRSNAGTKITNLGGSRSVALTCRKYESVMACDARTMCWLVRVRVRAIGAIVQRSIQRNAGWARAVCADVMERCGAYDAYRTAPPYKAHVYRVTSSAIRDAHT